MDELDTKVQHEREAICDITEQDERRASRLLQLAISLQTRFSQTENFCDLNEAAQLSREAIKLTPKNSPDRACMLRCAMMPVGERFLQFKNLEDAAGQFEDLATEALSLLPEESFEDAPLEVLARSFLGKYSAGGEVDDLEASIWYLQKIMTLGLASKPQTPRSDTLRSLGTYLQDESSKNGDTSIAAQAQHILRLAENRLSAELHRNGKRFVEQFWNSQSTSDLNEAIDRLTLASEAASHDYPELMELLGDCGLRYMDRFERTGAMDDLERSIGLSQRALGMAVPGSVAHCELMHQLLYGRRRRFNTTENVDDLEEALRLGRDALQKAPGEFPDRLRVNLLINLADVHLTRYQRLGESQDVEQAIGLGKRVLELIVPGDPDHGVALCNLATALRSSYSQGDGDLKDLEDSIQLASKALGVGDSEYSKDLTLQLLETTAGGLLDRYERFRTADDLQEALAVSKKALDLASPNHPRYISHLTMHTIILTEMNRATGSPAYLDESIDLQRRGVAVSPSKQGERLELAQILNSLGSNLSLRYIRFGALADLEESIQHYRSAARLVPENHPERYIFIANLMHGLATQHDRTGSKDCLDEAIRAGEDALELCPEDHPDRCSIIMSLSHRHFQRHRADGAISDLDESVTLNRVLLSVKDASDVRRAGWLSDLANHLGHRHLLTRDARDLEEALSLVREALELMPRDYPERAKVLGVAGDTFHQQELTTGDFDEAMGYYHQGLAQESASVRTRLAVGSRGLDRCVSSRQWEQAYHFAAATSRLIPKLMLRSLRTADKQHLLGKLVGLARDGAAIALEAGRGASSALQFLEVGRGVLAGSLEELRMDVDDLRRVSPQLAERFTSLCSELDTPEDLDQLTRSGRSGYYSDGQMQESKQANNDQRHQAGKELDKIIDEIRTLSGFEDFLAAPSQQAAQDAAKLGPIVVINVSLIRCGAIIVEEHLTRSIPLPKLKVDDIGRVAGRDFENGVHMLAWMWDTITSPILADLGFESSPSAKNPEEWPRVTWVPTGPLVSLPLHASGLYRVGDPDAMSVLDRVVSSYSPSVKVLIHGRRRRYSAPLLRGGQEHKALLVAMPQTPGCSPLQFVSDEITAVDRLCREMGLQPVQSRLPSEQYIRAHLSEGQCTVFHFAGHGLTNSRDPARSGLILNSNGQRSLLTVASLVELNLRQKLPFMAYLSACGTGKISHRHLLDENIHPISGFQLAGFRHVIGTLGNVEDQTCVDMARFVYEGLRGSILTDDSVRLAFHNATRKLRGRWLRSADSQAFPEQPSAREGDSPETGREELSREDEGDGQPRKIVVAVDDGEEVDGRGSLLWVPYVYFGT